MTTFVEKSRLTPSRRALVELLQRVNFGIVHELQIRDRQPVLDPDPHVIREIKLGGENGPRSELSSPSFRLRQQWIELFELFDSIGTGVLESVEFKHGIPFKVMADDSQF